MTNPAPGLYSALQAAKKAGRTVEVQTTLSTFSGFVHEVTADTVTLQARQGVSYHTLALSYVVSLKVNR